MNVCIDCINIIQNLFSHKSAINSIHIPHLNSTKRRNEHLFYIQYFEPSYFDQVISTKLFWPSYFDLVISTKLFRPYYFDQVISIILFRPSYFNQKLLRQLYLKMFYFDLNLLSLFQNTYTPNLISILSVMSGFQESKFVVVLGIPLVGKSTLCNYLEKTYGFIHIPLGKLIQENITYKQTIEEHIWLGQLVPSYI